MEKYFTQSYQGDYLTEESLEHYGVKGMRWRHHKKKQQLASGRVNKLPKYEVPGAEQGRALADAIEEVGRGIREGVKNVFMPKVHAEEAPNENEGMYVYKYDKKSKMWVSTGKKVYK